MLASQARCLPKKSQIFCQPSIDGGDVEVGAVDGEERVAGTFVGVELVVLAVRLRAPASICATISGDGLRSSAPNSPSNGHRRFGRHVDRRHRLTLGELVGVARPRARRSSRRRRRTAGCTPRCTPAGRPSSSRSRRPCRSTSGATAGTSPRRRRRRCTGRRARRPPRGSRLAAVAGRRPGAYRWCRFGQIAT